MIKNNIIYDPYSDWRFKISKAKGSYVWDQDGNKLIDFTSGWNVTNLGWNNSEVIEALISQAKKNTHSLLWTSEPIQEKYAQAFIKSLPKELCALGRATSGTEANEEAIKTARVFTGRNKILGFRNAYHGQSFSTLAIGFPPESSNDPAYRDFIQIEFPKLYGKTQNSKMILQEFAQDLEKKLSKRDVAAMVVEAGIITGAGSTFVAPEGCLKIIRTLTKKYGTLLILDEVGTGFSRCGKLYGMNIENIVPDIATFAKGISNGAVAIGTMVTTKEIAEKTFETSQLISTFGWTPIACAASLKVLEIHQRDKIWLKAEKDGTYLLKKLKDSLTENKFIEDISGRGMEIGVHFTKPLAVSIVNEAQKRGLHLVCDTNSNIQIMPPLTISRKDLDQGINILLSVIDNITRKEK